MLVFFMEDIKVKKTYNYKHKKRDCNFFCKKLKSRNLETYKNYNTENLSSFPESRKDCDFPEPGMVD